MVVVVSYFTGDKDRNDSYLSCKQILPIKMIGQFTEYIIDL